MTISKTTIPKGWKLVPLQMTGDQIAAFRDEFYKDEKHFDYIRIYEAILDAAPEPPIAKPTIEQMTEDLIKAGWHEVRFGLWKNPQGLMFRGPALAWEITNGRI